MNGKLRGWMTRICFTAMLTGLLTGVPAGGQAAAVETKTPQSPRTGETVTWDCVYFGSYPQTEITKEKDPELYTQLDTVKGWIQDECTLQGIHYRRIREEDTVSRAGGYVWDSGDVFHYFSYDSIKWRVLQADDSELLLISDQALDVRQYHQAPRRVSWALSTLRSWLNGYAATANAAEADYAGHGFIDAAFSEDEQKLMRRKSVSNPASSVYGTSTGEETEDAVWLLSEEELKLNSYGFSSDVSRQAKGTAFAEAMGAELGNTAYWSRTQGKTELSALFVTKKGSLYTKGYTVASRSIAVRPVISLDLTKIAKTYSAGTVGSDGSVDEIAPPAPGEKTPEQTTEEQVTQEPSTQVQTAQVPDSQSSTDGEKPTESITGEPGGTGTPAEQQTTTGEPGETETSEQTGEQPGETENPGQPGEQPGGTVTPGQTTEAGGNVDSGQSGEQSDATVNPGQPDEQSVTEQSGTGDTAEQVTGTENGIVKGGSYTIAGLEYVVTSLSGQGGTVTFTGYQGTKKELKIPDVIVMNGQIFTVNAIAKNSCKGKKDLTRVVIGNQVTVIGSSAFSGCKKLKKVTIGKKVRKISDSAFVKCTSLGKLTVPASVVNLGKNSFAGCRKLSKIQIKTKHLKKAAVGTGVFKGISAKAVIRVPKGKQNDYEKVFRKKGKLPRTAKVK